VCGDALTLIETFVLYCLVEYAVSYLYFYLCHVIVKMFIVLFRGFMACRKQLMK